MNQGIHQVKVASGEAAQPNKGFERVAFFDEAGAPVDVGGGQSLTAMSAAAAEAGTDTTARSISAKVLADEIDRRVAAALAAQA